MAGSPFAVRGVIEGFYGRPWTHQQRLGIIDFIGQRDMNLFMYGPKDDPLVRRDWRLAYDGPARARLQELVGPLPHVRHGTDAMVRLARLVHASIRTRQT